jgi:hypothetical protein
MLFLRRAPPAEIVLHRKHSCRVRERLKDVPQIVRCVPLWNIANLSCSRRCSTFQNYVGMGPFNVSLCRGISLVGFAVSSLYWGNFSNREDTGAGCWRV